MIFQTHFNPWGNVTRSPFPNATSPAGVSTVTSSAIDGTETTPLVLTLTGTTSKSSALYSGELSVAAVPEPETYAMFVAGLGALAFMARRRRQQA